MPFGDNLEDLTDPTSDPDPEVPNNPPEYHPPYPPEVTNPNPQPPSPDEP